MSAVETTKPCKIPTIAETDNVDCVRGETTSKIKDIVKRAKSAAALAADTGTSATPAELGGLAALR